MTFPNHPYHVQQAVSLLEQGHCQLPVDWSDLARKVASHEHYSNALMQYYQGNDRLMRMLTENCAMDLCREQDNGL